VLQRRAVAAMRNVVVDFIRFEKTLDPFLLGTARCCLAFSLPAAINRPPDILPARENCEGFTRKQPSIKTRIKS